MDFKKIETLIPTLTALGAGIYSFFKWVLPQVKEIMTMIQMSNKRRMEEATSEIVSIIYYMRDIINYTDATNVMLFKAHNGGGPIEIGSWIYASLLYEVHKPGGNGLRSFFPPHNLDEEHIIMLNELQKNSILNHSVKEMPQSNLKDILDGNGVMHEKAIGLFTAKDRSKYFYLSITFSKDESEIKPAERAQIRALSNAIANIYKKNSYYV